MLYGKRPDNSWTSSERLALRLLWAVSAAGLAGFATFSAYPQLLNAIPGAAQTYGWMFAIAPRVQIVTAFAALALVLARRAGTRWVAAFAALCVLSLGSELAGTTIGLPFGPYSYTDGLGPKLFGHVPVLIPLSWFFMAIPSYAIAMVAFGGRSRTVTRILLASFILLVWDLVLDPAMSLVTKYWVWATPGPYYGMPLLNLLGWYVTGLALMAALAALRADAWLERIPVNWLGSFYGANLLLPLGMSAVAGHWGALLATLVAAAGVALVLLRARARSTAPRTVGEFA